MKTSTPRQHFNDSIIKRAILSLFALLSLSACGSEREFGGASFINGIPVTSGMAQGVTEGRAFGVFGDNGGLVAVINNGAIMADDGTELGTIEATTATLTGTYTSGVTLFVSNARLRVLDSDGNALSDGDCISHSGVNIVCVRGNHVRGPGDVYFRESDDIDGTRYIIATIDEAGTRPLRTNRAGDNEGNDAYIVGINNDGEAQTIDGDSVKIADEEDGSVQTITAETCTGGRLV
ncbi:MAG: hypothetical protein GDA54_06355, partial [Alphaproteobacteria bacterium GM7ARS4]|nr:hypothetical protein [Alphaproteobacteria bacterium GM7ARS4]